MLAILQTMEIAVNFLILLAVLVTFSIALLETLSRCHEFKRDLLNANQRLENKTELKLRFV
jgi:hypothetical protein